jgi:hypothetical protein
MNVKLTAKELEKILSALNYQSEYFYTQEEVETYGWEKDLQAVENLIEKLEKVGA